MSANATVPASLIQQQFWVLNQQSPASPAYHVPSVFRIEGRLDGDALNEAFNALLRRHGVFRARLHIDESGSLVQSIHPWRHQALPQEDLRQSRSSGAEAAWEEAAADEIRRPFDLANDQPVRIKLFRTAESSFVLVIVAHHGVFDLATKDLFAGEFSVEYSRLVRGLPETAATDGARYEDYCLWQQQWLEQEDCHNLVQKWQRYLEDAAMVIHLPTDRPRPAGASQAGTVVPLRFSADRVGRIRQFSRDEAVTPYLVILTAWALTLGRWSGQAEYCVGIPLSNRRHEAFKNTMGCFVNILPLVVDLSGDPTLQQLLRRVRMGMLFLHRMQEVPYLQLVQIFRSRLSAGVNPLFQVGFTFEHPMRLRLEGLRVEPAYVHHGDAQLDLFATCWEENQEIAGVIEYTSDVLDAATVARIGESLLQAVDELVGNPLQTVDKVTLVPPEDLDRIVHDWNGTAAANPAESTVHGLFAAQAGKTPGAVAVRCGADAITYSELRFRAESLARYLRFAGVRPGEPVGVCVERNTDMVAVLLGVLMSGGSYVPLDPAFPAERLRYMAADAGVRFVVGSSALRSLAETVGGAFVPIDDRAWRRFSLSPDPVGPSGVGDLAYVMYTSGSTGQPKGVEVPHRAVVNFLGSMSRKPGLTAGDVLLSVTTVSFDISVLELFLPLTCGACVVIAPAEATFDGRRLLQLMEQVQPSVMQATPVTWRLLLESGWQGSPELKALCGGEAMTADLMQELLRRCKEVWNMYGPTETTVWSTCQRCRPEQSRVLIGMPIDNTVTYILDVNSLPVPIGVWGELYIGGLGVARGYRNLPHLTAERFVPDCIVPGGGVMYRTGDRCRYRQDGAIEHGGRLDSQVKVRGFRIEPGDIESCLMRHPAVRGVSVDARDDPAGRTHLIAWVQFGEHEEADTLGLRGYLRRHLPEHMIPQIFKPVDRFPLTPNKKVDRKALPDPWEGSPAASPQAARRGDPGSAVCDVRSVWEVLLAHADFENDTPFFDAGGYSLLAVRLCDLLAAQWNVSLSPAMVFQYPTVRQQAEFLQQRGIAPEADTTWADRARLKAAGRVSMRKKAGDTMR